MINFIYIYKKKKDKKNVKFIMQLFLTSNKKKNSKGLCIDSLYL